MNLINLITFISGLICCISQTECEVEDIASVNSTFINLNVVTTLDISSQVVKKSHEIVLRNNGNVSVTSFLIAIEPNLTEKLSYIEVVDEFNNMLTVNPIPNLHLQKVFNVILNQLLESQDSATVVVKTAYTGMLLPFPNVIKQFEPHLVQFSGNMVFYSPYFTLHQETNIIKGNGSIEEAQGNYIIVSGKNIECENISTVPPYSEHVVNIHYNNNSPFLTITQLKRNIYVSQWGFIRVTEEINIKNTGAKFEGPFFRSPLSTNQISQFIIKLPYNAYHIELSDEIGKISSYEITRYIGYILLTIKTRFVLNGGWKTYFVLSYIIPANELYRNLTDYGSTILKINVIENYSDYIAIEKALVNIILPEGATFLKLEPPYDVHLILNSQKVYSVLDTIGRVNIGFELTNLVHEHSKLFILKFHFTNVILFKNTILKVGLLTVIIYLVLIFTKYCNTLLDCFF